MSPLTFDLLESVAQLDRVASEWCALLARQGNEVPFLSPDWFKCCAAAYGHGKDLRIVVVREGQDLLGVLPLWAYASRVRSVPVRRLGFIACPDTPFADFVAATDRREEIVPVLVDYLFHMHRGKAWDVFSFQVPEDSPNLPALRKSLQRRKHFIDLGSVTPTIPINCTWEDFLQTRSQKFRKTHRNIINRFGKLPNVEIQCIRQDSNGAAVEEMLAVSRKGWKHGRGISIASQAESIKFFESFTPIAGDRKWLMGWLLKVDGRPVAMEYDLAALGRVYALRCDYDEAFKQHSPGSYLEYRMMEKLFSDGYTEYSSGPGLNDYKLHWTENVRRNVLMEVMGDSIRGWGLYRLKKLAAAWRDR